MLSFSLVCLASSSGQQRVPVHRVDCGQWQCTGKSLLISSIINDVYIYCIVPNFRGTKFSRIGLLQIFAEKNFADKGFPLVTLGSRMHYSCRFVLTTPSLAACFQIQAFLLRGKPRLEPSRVSFVGDHQLRLSSRRCLPIDKRNRNLRRRPPGIWKRSLWNNDI